MKRHLFRRMGRFLRPQAPSLAGAAALAALSGLLALLVPLVAGWAVEAIGTGPGLRFSQQGAQSVQCTGLQSALQKQVTAGIAGQAELGEHGQLYAAGCSFVQSIRDLPDIIGAVGHPQCGRKGGCFQKTIFHRRISHPVFLS